jgi:GntR family transcriptional repressor for pyruvate dehydrogenase complex
MKSKEPEYPKETLTQQTIRNILNLIDTEGLESGDFIPTEAVMLKTFGISRIILREALSYLKGLGLLVSRRGSGFKIAEVDFIETFSKVLKHLSHFNLKNLTELMELRRIMEVGALDIAIKNATEDDMAEIERLQKELEDIADSPENSRHNYQFLDMQFHNAITRPAGCRLLIELNNTIWKFYKESRQSDIIPFEKNQNEMSRSTNEHSIIANAFRLKQPEIAISCLRKHLEPTLKPPALPPQDKA